MKNNVLILSAFAAVLVFGVLFSNQSKLKRVLPSTNDNKDSSTSESVHFHAAFHHYKDGVLQDYSDFRYMSVVPCSTNDHTHDTENLLEQVHLHDGNGEVVHVHAQGITWQHLFDSLGITVKEPTVYVNDEMVNEGLSNLIGEYDRVVIWEGEPSAITEDIFSSVPSKELIQQAESASELCSV